MKVSIVFLLIIVDMFVLCNLFKLYVQCAATFWSVHLKEMAEVTQFSPSTEVCWTEEEGGRLGVQ